MFVFLLQLRHAVNDQGGLSLFVFFSSTVWLLWSIKTVLSRHYVPWSAPHGASASIVIPVVAEPLDLFRDVLRRIVAQKPHETLVVINGPRNIELESVCDEFRPWVQRVWTPVPGKRNAVRVGVAGATGEIVVLVDSDTLWEPDTLPELIKPFADLRVGGATTRQRILAPERSWITRWADWLENSRALYSMPAQSVLGQVGCLPGRTIAFRRDLLDRVMHDFMSARFLGIFLEISDDRTLTNLVLKQGFRCVYQHTSLVHTDAPTRPIKLFKQQLRWARGSQYNTLRMLPWMLAHAPILCLFFVADVLLPFLQAGTFIVWGYRAVTHTGVDVFHGLVGRYGAARGLVAVVGLIVVGSLLSMAIRQMRHLQQVPSDVARLPFFIIFSTLFLTPVRLLGFMQMAHVSGWGTRDGAYGGASDDETIDLDLGTASRSGEVHLPRVPAARASTGAPVTHRREVETHNGSGARARPATGSVAVRTRPQLRRDVLAHERALRAPHPAASPVTRTDPQRPPALRPTSSRRRSRLVAVPYVLAAVILAAEVAPFVF